MAKHERMGKVLRWLLDYEAIVMAVAVAIYFLTRDSVIDLFRLPNSLNDNGLVALYFIPYYVLARCIVALLKRKRFPRIRGDRPIAAGVVHQDGTVPPHTRG